MNVIREQWMPPRYSVERTKVAERIRQVNSQRIPKLQQHLAQSGTCFVELYCGILMFARELSSKTGEWVLGVDWNEAPSCYDICIHPEDYEKAERVVYLSSANIKFLTEKDKYRWLVGSVAKAFMILPEGQSHYLNEVDMFLRFSCPDGELHVRTEQNEVYKILEEDFAMRKIRKRNIPFYPEALDIRSCFMRKHNLQNEDLSSFGFKLLSS